MLRLNRRRRDALAETTRELANLIAAALMVSPFVSQQQPSWRLVLWGATIWVALVGGSLVFEGD